MIALALRGLGERKLRTALTAIAIVLGVAMIAGTYVQTDRIRSAFEEITQSSNRGTDVVVDAREAFTSSISTKRESVDMRLVARLREIPGVARVEGRVEETGSLVVDGEVISSGFAPALVLSAVGEPFDPLEMISGRAARRPGEVVIDRGLAEDHGLEPGDRARLTTRTGSVPVVISGVASYGTASSLGGATLVVPRLADVHRWFGNAGRVTQILIAGEDGVAAGALAERVRAAVPRTLEVTTGQQEARKVAETASDALGSFLTPALLALAGAALLVGAFIIFNTFSITVAQRTREFGLLRALGATRRDILKGVVAEAALLGVVSSVIGLLAGLGVAALLGVLFDAAGFGIPAGGLELLPRTIAIALTVGIGVTLVSALGPARRAMAVPPIAALREDADAAGPQRSGRRRALVAGAVILAGTAMLLQGLFGGGPASGRLGSLAGGAILLFVGIALVARYIVRPLAGAIGWPIEHAFHEPGRLARENAMRNPARTATTSAALMVGLGLVVFVAVFAAGLKTSLNGSLDDLMKADLMVTSTGFVPMSEQVGAAIADVPGVEAVGPFYGDQIRVEGRSVNLTTDVMDGVDPATILTGYEPEWLDGSDALLGRLRGDDVILEEQFAERHGLEKGERFRIETPSGRKATFTAIGEYRDPLVLQGMMVALPRFKELSAVDEPFGYFVVAADGRTDAAAAAVKAALGDRFPTAEVRTNDEYRDLIGDQVDSIVYLLYALLAMSLVISLFGIVNSLFLSVFERTREFGLLRSVGATQEQVRRVVRYESVITAVIGALLGIVIGVVFAALATSALSSLGLELALPAGQLAVFLVLAIVVGIVGAVVPARRAAGVDVLAAMRQE